MSNALRKIRRKHLPTKPKARRIKKTYVWRQGKLGTGYISDRTTVPDLKRVYDGKE